MGTIQRGHCRAWGEKGVIGGRFRGRFLVESLLPQHCIYINNNHLSPRRSFPPVFSPATPLAVPSRAPSTAHQQPPIHEIKGLTSPNAPECPTLPPFEESQITTLHVKTTAPHAQPLRYR